MACLTFRIVIRGLVADLRMRVVTRQAAYARIVRIVAFAACQTIRLIANVGDTKRPLHCDLCPRPVALAAEV